MKIFKPLFCAVVATLTFNSCAQKKAAVASIQKSQPNVIFIIADDLGYADIGSYGSSFYDTPNLDKLANNATRFTNGYANCPVCSPSRASFQTGKYPVNTGYRLD
jgi:arylsulfatase A-like enzyme